MTFARRAFYSSPICLLLIAGATLASAPAQASREELQQSIATGAQPADTVNELASLARSTHDAALVSEYSLALASSGLVSAALSEMDRAFLLGAGNDNDVLYAGSVLLAYLGLSQAADEFKRPAPDWVKGTLPLLSKPKKRSDVYEPMGGFGAELSKAAALMEKSRFVSALDRFARLTAVYPREPLGWSGYAVALEKVGAYKTAAKAVGVELALNTRLDSGERELLTEHQKDLEARPPLEPRKLNEALAGQYTAFAGGSLTGASGTTSTYSLNAQFGKFLTNHLNVSVDASYSSVSHWMGGLGARLYLPLPITAPLSLTGGTRIEYGDGASMIVSPGMSYFIGHGSFDIFVDFGVAGPQQGTKTVSAGYTFFLGLGGA